MPTARHLALVTGASRGLGRALAVELARRDHDVVLVARSAADLEAVAADVTAHGRVARQVVCDVSDAAQLRALGAYDDADLVVANAAALRPLAKVQDLQPQDWHEVMATNVVAPAVLLSTFLPAMTARRSGTLVAVSSSAAELALATMAPYCASKAALEQLCRVAAAEVEGAGVRVVAVRPGAIDTAMQAALRDGDAPLAQHARRAAQAGMLHDAHDVAVRLLDAVAASTGCLLDLGP